MSKWAQILLVLGAAALGFLIPFILNGEMPSKVLLAAHFLLFYAAGYFVLGTCLGIRIPTMVLGLWFVELGRLGCALAAACFAGVAYLLL